MPPRPRMGRSYAIGAWFERVVKARLQAAVGGALGETEEPAVAAATAAAAVAVPEPVVEVKPKVPVSIW